MPARPKLRLDDRGFVWYADGPLETRLPLRMVGGELEFVVKEKWLRPKLGEKVMIPIRWLLELAGLTNG